MATPNDSKTVLLVKSTDVLSPLLIRLVNASSVALPPERYALANCTEAESALAAIVFSSAVVALFKFAIGSDVFKFVVAGKPSACNVKTCASASVFPVSIRDCITVVAGVTTVEPAGAFIICVNALPVTISTPSPNITIEPTGLFKTKFPFPSDVVQDSVAFSKIPSLFASAKTVAPFM